MKKIFFVLTILEANKLKYAPPPIIYLAKAMTLILTIIVGILGLTLGE